MSIEDQKADPATEADRQKSFKTAKAKTAAEPGPGEGSGNQASCESLEERLRRLEEENAALKEQLLRRAAEFENFRKRLNRDKEEAVRYANAMLLGDVIPIIDDFERAIQSAEQSKDFAAFHAGVSLIERQLVSVLERNWGLKRFSARTGPEGELFDPEKHQAIAVEQTAGLEQPVVLENYQNGYYLHDRVLRPAQVKVAMPIRSDNEEKKE